MVFYNDSIQVDGFCRYYRMYRQSTRIQTRKTRLDLERFDVRGSFRPDRRIVVCVLVGSHLCKELSRYYRRTLLPQSCKVHPSITELTAIFMVSMPPLVTDVERLVLGADVGSLWIAWCRG